MVVHRAIDGRPGEWLFDGADLTRARAALSSFAGRLGTGSGVGPSLDTGPGRGGRLVGQRRLVLDDDGLAVATRGALDRARAGPFSAIRPFGAVVMDSVRS